MDTNEQIVRVDQNGHCMGFAKKLEAHENAWLHAAFSVLIVDCLKNPQTFLCQKRHKNKYHSGGLWSNACCGHPRPNEDLSHAAHRRLWEEMGISCSLIPIRTIVYQLDVGNGLIEHERNQIFMGQYSVHGTINPNPMECQDWKWINKEDLYCDLAKNEKTYTAWLPLILEEYIR